MCRVWTIVFLLRFINIPGLLRPPSSSIVYDSINGSFGATCLSRIDSRLLSVLKAGLGRDFVPADLSTGEAPKKAVPDVR